MRGREKSDDDDSDDDEETCEMMERDTKAKNEIHPRVRRETDRAGWGSSDNDYRVGRGMQGGGGRRSVRL